MEYSETRVNLASNQYKELNRKADFAEQFALALEAILNSDMVMREEDEGRKSKILDAARQALANYRGTPGEQGEM